MRRFTQLFTEIDESNRTSVKVAALVRYFDEAPARDAAWALFFLTGRRLKAPVKTASLRTWAADLTGLPLWLIEASYANVGDLAETLALLLPDSHDEGTDLPLHQLIEERVQPLADWDDALVFRLLRETWDELSSPQRFVFNKLLTGAFRVGVQRTLVVRALAQHADLPTEVIAHRLMGPFEPTVESYERLFLPADADLDDPNRPYPFCLAYPLEAEPENLGTVEDWLVESKWDGIRAQLIKRAGVLILWSRGEEALTERFPEIMTAAAHLPDGTVLDGEVLAWRDDAPLPFSTLQRRIGRKTVSRKLLEEAPCAFMAYDCLEADGNDLREKSTSERRAALEAILGHVPRQLTFHLSPLLEATTWEEHAEHRRTARERHVEGLMLKRKDAPYRTGRVKGDWWKWKVEPRLVDAVMIYAQAGHGRRAGLFTDYTFAVRADESEGAKLLPVAKAYSGLTDAEIRKVDAWIKRHTLQKHGPVRVVEPLLVFELAFEGINESTRHKSGIALRFPRINRWREDKPASEIDTIETLRAMLG